MSQGTLEVAELLRKSAYSFCFVECCLNPSIIEKLSIASMHYKLYLMSSTSTIHFSKSVKLLLAAFSTSTSS